MEIKSGMIVWLKSGSPAMTVHSQARPNDWICHWFVGTKAMHGTYHSSQLTDKDPNPPMVFGV